jgi:hypothetical protein
VGGETARPKSWESLRDAYLEERLTCPSRGQIAYYARHLERAGIWRTVLQSMFYFCSAMAMIAVVMKILLHAPGAGVLLGLFAIVLPAVAVGALSLSASFDIEARIHTYAEMLRFLNERVRWIEQSVSEREFMRLAQETESRLLGETAGWYLRRSFTGIA